MLGRLAVIGALAIGAGMAISLRDLLIPPPRHIPLPVGDLVLFAWVVALAAIGWTSTQLLGAVTGALAAPVAGLVAVAIAIAAKTLRFPDAPLTGDGFEILIWIYMGVALVAALAGLHPAIRARSARAATRLGAGVIVVAALLAAIPYVLASS